MRGKGAHWISSYRSSAGEKVNRRREGRGKKKALWLYCDYMHRDRQWCDVTELKIQEEGVTEASSDRGMNYGCLWYGWID